MSIWMNRICSVHLVWRKWCWAKRRRRWGGGGGKKTIFFFILTLLGIVFLFELSPITVDSVVKQMTFFHFLTNLLAILGGVFTISSLVCIQTFSHLHFNLRTFSYFQFILYYSFCYLFFSLMQHSSKLQNWQNEMNTSLQLKDLVKPSQQSSLNYFSKTYSILIAYWGELINLWQSPQTFRTHGDEIGRQFMQYVTRASLLLFFELRWRAERIQRLANSFDAITQLMILFHSYLLCLG